ncbi:MAG: DUF4136 domain-containing protein [bacterium]
MSGLHEVKMIARLAYAFAFLSLLIVYSGCARVKIKTNYDHEFDFRQFKTYAWLPGPNKKLAHITDPVAVRLKLEQRITERVDHELSKMGYTLAAQDPDFLVAYHTGLHDKLRIQDWGYAYARSSRYWGGRDDIELTFYKEGTVILDFVDATTRKLRWRGVATGMLPQGKPDPDLVGDRIREAVQKILMHFPPER